MLIQVISDLLRELNQLYKSTFDSILFMLLLDFLDYYTSFSVVVILPGKLLVLLYLEDAGDKPHPSITIVFIAEH